MKGIKINVLPLCLPPPKQHSARSKPWNKGGGPGFPPQFFFGPSGLSFVFLHQSNTVPDPDPEIRGEGPVSPPFFLALWASVWSKNKGGQPPQNPPLDPPLQHNLVPLRASWLPSLLLAIILYYWCHFLNITTVLQIWSMLRVAYYEKLAEEFVPISHGEIFLMNDDKFYLNEWMDTFI